MLTSSLYIIGCTLRNRAKRWAIRLREPRYLALALAGLAYVGGIIFLRVKAMSMASAQRAAPSALDALPALAVVGSTAGGLLLLAAAAASWLFPGGGGLLQFTRAEVQFLFPSPVSRRRLVAYRMLRSQIGLLFGSFVSAIAIPSASWPTRARVTLTLWILLFTAKVYFAGVAITRRRFESPRARERYAARLIPALVVGALVVVVVSLAQQTSPVRPGTSAISRFAFTSMPRVAQALLLPFAMLVRPIFVDRWGTFAVGLSGAILVLICVCAWVMFSDKTFERVLSEPGLRRKGGAVTRGTGTAWRLGPSGPVETALAWKSVLQTLRVIDARILTRVAAVVVWVVVAIVSSNRGQGLATIFGLFAATAAGITVFIGPMVLRIDLRQDLQHLELLKTWPVPGAVLIRGTLIWPSALLSAIAWAMIALALVLSTAIFPDASWAVRWVWALSALVLIPALVAAQLLIHNAGALVFPAWMATGSQRSRGLDVIGQRMVLVGGTLVLLVIGVVPGALVGWLLWFVLTPAMGQPALVAAAAICAAILVGEVLAVAEALGPAYERLDVLAVERNE